VCLSRQISKDEVKNGFGTMSSQIAEIRYEGEIREGKKEGIGRIWWSNGDRYLGDWKKDSKEGFGFMMWENGDRYEGWWKADLREGPGARYTYANGGLFQGSYHNDERHGPGVFTWPDGDRFEGAWKCGGRHGHGVLVLKTGHRIEQDWNEPHYVNYSDTLPIKYPNEKAPAQQ